jgi:hypothetical protein
VHDFFEILGLPSSAPPMEVRQVCARRVRRSHPDFHVGGAPAAPQELTRDVTPSGALEVAVDFVDMSGLLDRMQAGFFRDVV